MVIVAEVYAQKKMYKTGAANVGKRYSKCLKNTIWHQRIKFNLFLRNLQLILEYSKQLIQIVCATLYNMCIHSSTVLNR